MILIVIAECLLSGLLGAILYRLAYAILGRRSKAWLVALLTAVAKGSGRIRGARPVLLREFAAKKVAPAILVAGWCKPCGPPPTSLEPLWLTGW